MRIEVEGLACRRGERTLFADLSFALGPGEALVVTGRNGAGKSSLLAILAGRLRPAGGRIALHESGERTLPECLHLVGHRDGLKTALTARENLAFARDLLGNPRLAPDEALDRVGLAHAAGLPVAYLSAGQRRRVALARLLVAHRPLWLLDEPAAALDAASRALLLALMTEHRAGGGLIIATTHAPLGLEDASEIMIERPAVAATQRYDPSPRLRGEGRSPLAGAEASPKGEGEGGSTGALDPDSPPHPRAADAALASPAGPQAKPSPRTRGEENSGRRPTEDGGA